MTSIAVPGTPLTPDQYKQYALGDPGYLSLQAALQGNENAFQSQARGGINKGVIALGLMPTDSSLSGWLDPGTAAAAQANPTSTAAGLNLAHTQNVRAIQNNLAARGAYDSGELTYGLGNENQRDTQARADAMAKFLDYANGLFGQLGTMKAADAGQLGQELGNAAMRQLALHPGSTTAAQWDDNSGTYVDGQGNHYDQYGNFIGNSGAPNPTPTNFMAQVNQVQAGQAPVSSIPSYDPGSYQGAYAQSVINQQNALANQPPPQPVITQGAPRGGGGSLFARAA